MLLNVIRECSSPEWEGVSQSKQDPAHAWLCCIDGSDHRWVVWNHFCQMGWSVGDVRGQGFEVIQVVLEVLGDLDPVLISMEQPELQGAKQAG